MRNGRNTDTDRYTDGDGDSDGNADWQPVVHTVRTDNNAVRVG
jgi:hypothetical protein